MELLFGNVRDGREIAVYDGISFLGSLPKAGSMPEDEAREAMGVVALKTLLATKDAKTIFVCRLPGAESNTAFAEAMDFTATMSGAIVFETRSSASPETGMVRPLFKTMVCDMYVMLYENQ